MKEWLRIAELAALTIITLSLLGVAAYMIYLDRMGEAFGSVLTTVPLVVQAIRGIGQSQAMNAMADALAASQPVAVTPPERLPAAGELDPAYTTYPEEPKP